jgi:hypothetical protein
MSQYNQIRTWTRTIDLDGGLETDDDVTALCDAIPHFPLLSRVHLTGCDKLTAKHFEAIARELPKGAQVVVEKERKLPPALVKKLGKRLSTEGS